MTREEAVEILQGAIKKPNTKDGYLGQAIDMAIKALEQKPRKDEVILTKEEYGELVSSEFDNGYAKGYREALEQESSYNSVNSLVESKLKDPKAKTFDILHFVADNAGLSTFEAIEKAYNMGVSEQEQVLDKIRSEIKNDWQLKKSPCSPFSCGLRQAIGIIDKYREEVNHRKVRGVNEQEK